MCEGTTQKAKEFHRQLVDQGVITTFYEGLVGDSVWASKRERAYKITDLADTHLQNIVNRFERESDEVPTVLKLELKRREHNQLGTRLFYVVDASEVNEEIFETLEEAEVEYKEMLKIELDPRIRICMVKNAYKEEGGGWNYDDLSNTFETVKVIKGE